MTHPQPNDTQHDDPAQAVLMAALQRTAPVAAADSTALEDLPGMDSLANVRLIAEIEHAIGGSLEIDDVLGLASVGDVRDLLRARGKRAG